MGKTDLLKCVWMARLIKEQIIIIYQFISLTTIPMLHEVEPGLRHFKNQNEAKSTGKTGTEVSIKLLINTLELSQFEADVNLDTIRFLQRKKSM